MALIIDFAAASRRLTDEEFAAWAQTQTIFLSSMMGELAAERRAVAEHLERLGATVRWFEEFGGRDDSAEAAYLTEVRSATLYLGLLGDAYGTMLASEPYSGFSATHAEYLEARRQGKRISFWVRAPGDERQGHARKFLAEVQLFHVTGTFAGAADLPRKVEKRLREIAADDLAPWVKLGDVIVRATRVEVGQDAIRVQARVHDSGVLRALAELAGDPRGFGGSDIAITYGNRSGTGRIQTLSEASTSAAFTDMTIEARANWAQGADTMAAGTQGYTAEALTELATNVGLLGEPMPTDLRQMAFLVKAEDPLAELQGLPVQEGAVQPLARLLVAEQLIGGRRASAIERDPPIAVSGSLSCPGGSLGATRTLTRSCGQWQGRAAGADSHPYDRPCRSLGPYPRSTMIGSLEHLNDCRPKSAIAAPARIEHCDLVGSS